jgi:DNA-binding IclR family transcriptional regulator
MAPPAPGRGAAEPAAAPPPAGAPPPPAGAPAPPPTLDRLVEVLFALAAARGPLSAAELAAATNLPVSSTYRLVGALEQHGFVDRRPRRGIALGLRILELARLVEERLEATLVQPARPVMERLARESGETVLLTAPVGSSSIGLASVPSPRPIRLTFARWRLAPIHRGASGKILLAHIDPDAAERVLASLHREEPGVDVEGLRGELADARRRGHVVTYGELDAGAGGIAAPVLDEHGRVVAGLTAAGPGPRIRAAERTVADAVVAASRAMETAVERSARATVAV